MNKNHTTTINPTNRLLGILLGIAILLLIPLIVMQFTDGVKWTLLDFIVMGILMLTTGLTLEFILRKVKTTQSRIIACAILFIVFLLVWIELAVGIFGTPFAGS